MRWQIALAGIVTTALAIVASIAHRATPMTIGRGPGPRCILPQRTCDITVQDCAELVEMPIAGAGYVDSRLDAEQTPETSTSYLRRDLMMAVQYAAAKVACKAADWNTGNGGPIVLGDMSERDGSTPGTQWDFPRHPRHTHAGGRDIDIAYFQRGTGNNEMRPICPYRSAAGVDEYRCLAAPTRLDPWRTALFIGAILEEPGVRVIGIDGGAAPVILAAFDELCDRAWIDPTACNPDRIHYETKNTRRGWFRGHHNHFHVSWSAK